MPKNHTVKSTICYVEAVDDNSNYDVLVRTKAIINLTKKGAQKLTDSITIAACWLKVALL